MSRTILIVDDHESIRRGIRSLLSTSTEWQVCGEACDGVEAVEKTRQLRPDVVLMDTTMPRLNGFQASRTIQMDRAAAKVVMISQNEPDRIAQQTRESGAASCIAKTALGHELIPVLHSLFETNQREGHTDRAACSAPVMGGESVTVASAARSQRPIRGGVPGLPFEVVRAGIGDPLQAAFEVADAERRKPFRAAAESARILVAEDDEGIREYLIHLLSADYRVLTAANGEEALEVAQREFPDLILSDVHLPLLDGFGLVRAIRADERTRALPAILLSAKAEEGFGIEAMHSGADDYVLKPVSSRELLARVSSRLEIARLRRDSELRMAADIRAMDCLREVGNYCVRAGNELPHCLEVILDAAIELTGAVKGALQLLDRASGDLCLAVSRGFQEPFLEFFALIRGEECACGAAMQSGTRIIVEDLTQPNIFSGKPSLAVALEANVRAVQSTPLMSSTGKLLGILSTHFNLPHRPTERELGLMDLLARQAGDYLERKQSEEAVRAASSQLQSFLDTAPVGLMRCSRDFRFLAANPAYAEIVGLPLDQIVGRGIRDVIGTEAWEKMKPGLERVLRGERVTYETMLPYNSGPRWVQVIKAPEFDAAGQVMSWVTSVMDVTERTREQEQVVQQANLLDLSHDAIFVCDSERHIVYWNKGAAETYGYTKAEVLGRTPLELLKTVFPENEESIFERFRSDQRWSGELIHTRRDGSQITVSSRWLLAPYGDGSAPSILAINRDITALKRAEAELQQERQELERRVQQRTAELSGANQLLSLLNARLLQAQDEERQRIARDLHDSAGQLLVGLGMNLGRIERTLPDAPRDLLEIARESQALVRQLSNEIRTTSYLLHPPLLEANGLPVSLDMYVRGFTERSGIRVDLRIQKPFGRLSKDMEVAVFRIVQESLTNIHRHSGSRTACIRISRGVTGVSLDIEDEGRGMSQEKLATNQAQGAGVGIAGMRERIRHLGGEMKIRSSSHGTQISVLLPVPKASSLEPRQRTRHKKTSG